MTERKYMACTDTLALCNSVFNVLLVESEDAESQDGGSGGG